MILLTSRGLDIGAIENIHKQIIRQRDAGKAILLISLELDEIMNCADTIGVIYNGEIQKIAAAKTLTSNEVGEFMIFTKMLKIKHRLKKMLVRLLGNEKIPGHHHSMSAICLSLLAGADHSFAYKESSVGLW